MKKVTRGVEPQVLRNNKSKWQRNFINEVKRNRGYKGMNAAIKNKYNQPEIKRALKEMYSGKCCYCENCIGTEGYENIEHLKPKSLSRFHMLAFSWENLHWCCQRCNTCKNDKWNRHYPILDPTKDNPENHIKIDTITGKIVYKTRRGKTTINHAQLNREGLVNARKRILIKLNDIFLMIRNTPSINDNRYLLKLLNDFINDDAEFSALIKGYINENSSLLKI
ncbi:MAG: hypothetical protein ABF608_06485 [Sporolactobacillus sp.]